MNNLTDKQRCELSFIGRLIYLLILGGVQSSNQQQLADIAIEVAEEPFIGVYDNGKLKRRVLRMEEYTINPMTNKAHGEKVILVCYFFINNLFDMNKLKVVEGSKLGELVDFLLSLIDTSNEVTQKRMASAEKQAAKWLELLQWHGYYL